MRFRCLIIPSLSSPLSLSLLFASAPALAAERGFTITDFDRIRIEGPYEVHLETGRSSSARASGERAALDQLSLSTQGNMLIIRPDRQNRRAGSRIATGPVVIRLSTRTLRGIALIGGAQLQVAALRAERLMASVEGSARLDLAALDVDRMDVMSVGSGTIGLAGKAKTLNVVLRGSARIAGEAMVANNLSLITESADAITLGARTTANVQAKGAGDVTILGRPACAVAATGAGTVRCGN